MKFFGRKKEMQILQEVAERSEEAAQLTVLLGRRRIGKTYLLRQLFSDNCLYLLAKSEVESTLCSTFQKQIKDELGIPVYGQLNSMRDVFEVLLRSAVERPFTLIIDEFQEFFYVREGIMADLQELWDKYKTTAKINFIACGSMYTLMNRLFFSDEQSMYDRADRKITLKPFGINEMKEILSDFSPNHKPEDLFCLYLLTGGVAKYIANLMDAKAFTKRKMLEYYAGPASTFLHEGNELMNMEFRKESKTYYSIMRLIADGKVYSSEMDALLNTTVSSYLLMLEKTYSIIEKRRPMFASESGKLVKYEIKDNFLNFWFRFVYPNSYLVETDRNDLLLEIIEKGYSQYSGLILERYFRQYLGENSRYTNIGNYWDRKGEDEIDIVAISELDKTALIGEVKINPDKISIPLLMQKAEKLKKHLKGYEMEYRGFSLGDVK